MRPSYPSYYACMMLVTALGSSAFSAMAQDAVVLDTIILQAESDHTLDQTGYVATRSRQATKLDTPVAEIP